MSVAVPDHSSADATRLCELVAAGDREAAVRLLRSFLVSAPEPATLIERLLVPVQRHVGRLVESARVDWSDAQAMTAIVEELLSRIAYHIRPRADRGAVVFACPPGEWHVLAARMASECLRAHGWSVTFTGASTPIEELARCAHTRPDAVFVLSCTLVEHLLGARDAIDALHEQSAPVLVGGPGFGPDDRRARALGADGWAASAKDADRVLQAWVREPPSVPSRHSIASALPGREARANIVDAARRELGRGDGAKFSARDVEAILTVIDVGLLTNDPRVVSETIRRFAAAPDARRQADDTMRHLLGAVSVALPAGPARDLVDAAAPSAGLTPRGR